MARRPHVSKRPSVFFSHSSRDAAAIQYLKEYFVQFTNQSIDVFLSSDGESIQFGTNWISAIEAGLKSSQILYAFISTNSLRSLWVPFEAGSAHGRGARVVPVALPGVEIARLPPPLSTLHGFNAHNAGGLNNLIEVCNQQWQSGHTLGFTDEHMVEFRGALGVPTSRSPLARWFRAIGQVALQVPLEPDAETAPAAVLDEFKEWLRSRNLPVTTDDDGNVVTPGVQLSAQRTPRGTEYTADLSAEHLGEAASIVRDFVATRNSVANANWRMRIDFREGITFEENLAHSSARLRDRGVQLHASGAFVWQKMLFRVGSSDFIDPATWDDFSSQPASIQIETPSLPSEANIAMLLNTLLDARVIYPSGLGHEVI